MSTPSTATAANPPHHLHYGYSHHQGYHHQGAVYNPNSAGFLNDSSLLNNVHYNYHSHQAPGTVTSAAGSSSGSRTVTHGNTMPRHVRQNPGTTAPQSSSGTATSRKRQRAPDWREFYKNGLPKEVIVIDDDDEDDGDGDDGSEPTASSSAARQRQKQIPGDGRQRPAAPAQVNGVGNTNKRRKVDALRNAYDPVHQAQLANPAVPASHAGGSTSAKTMSTDRTASAVNTTAPTSLGSHHSQSGLGHAAYDDGQATGQKRKRTRNQLAEEAKRMEMERQGDAYSDYFPPPKPPIKAKDVYVSVVHDHSSQRNQTVDDEDGHYIVNADSDLTDRYQICRLLGQGTFGKVVEAYDRRKRVRCAIKIIRSVQKYRDASRIELRVLSTLASNDRENRNKCIHVRDCFDFRNHICIVTDLLGQSVFDFLKSNQFTPFPNSHIQSFARQLFTSVAFLHDLNLIHTDLKPENILLVDGGYQTFTYSRPIPSSSTTISRTARQRKVLLDTEIRLIDFGSATFDEEYHSSVVSTRHYRAPEIILGLGWSFPCDIWSIGCILVEFFTGDALFQTHDNLEHLAMMESVCGGKIDSRLVRQVYQTGRGHGGNPATKFFVKHQRLDYPNSETTKASKKYVKAMKRLQDIIPATTRFNRQFLDLLRRIFLYDPAQRITAKQALQHPWFKETTIDDGSEAARIRMKREREKAAAAAAAVTNGQRYQR
ncbi:MAG: dual specificity protein kinase kns1 [Lichina confinis]|nr:MAG: dual specificity protein kinase kns1 [Lichina confinis]